VRNKNIFDRPARKKENRRDLFEAILTCLPSLIPENTPGGDHFRQKISALCPVSV
jgi:hypothetical protein